MKEKDCFPSLNSNEPSWYIYEVGQRPPRNEIIKKA